ncbi:hypothetical protein BSL78_23418 [Apostichopus japonicus]|uniref:Uncharacterized protein n=1 Tax=Stichopus japonicus TaxID=307972 RepID=A0A2G8JVI3_STIJA|nr:hypothetical protein BSL78_23418 [Apostichopus japonicus]
MGIHWRGQVGVGHSRTRISNRILLQPTLRGRRKTDTHTHRPRQTPNSRRGNSGPAGQAGNCGGTGRDGTTLPVLFLSDQKTGRHLASHPKSKTPQHKIYQAKTLPYGNPKYNITPTQKGHVGGDRRLTGRLPTHPSAQGSPTVSNVPVCRTGLPVQGAPVRPVHGPQSLHENSGSGSLLPQKERGHPVRVPRRLVGGRELSVRGRRQRTQNAPYPPRAGLDREREEVSTISNSDDPVPWSDTRLLRRGSPTLGRKDHCGQDDHATDLVTPRVTQNDVAPSPGTHGQSGRCSPTVQVTHATPTASPPEVRRPHRSGHDNTNPQVGGNHSTPPMVARPRQLESRGTFHNRATNDICNDRRFTHRMGGSLEQPHSLGNVVPNRKIIPHQYPGDDRSQESSGNLQEHIQGTITTVFTDNTTVVAYINRQGGTHSEKLCRLAWEVITAAEDSGTILRASHIAGKLNVMADALSRGHLDPNEWTLEQETCNRIFAIFGKPMIDLFATYTNSKLQTFCSRRFHPQAYHTDAMSLPWDHLEAYVFPPLCMVGQVLRKIRNSKGRFILIAPFWPRRPWFAEIPQLLMDVPASLPDKPHLLSQRQGTLSHPDIKGLQLVAWKLSGLPYDREVFQRQLPRWQPTLEGERPQRLTIPACGSSNSGAGLDRYCLLRSL